MRIGFNATDGTFESDEYAIVAGVTDGVHYLMFQRDAEESEEDWGVYLEYDDQSNGGYECIASCSLQREKLTVELSQQLGGLAGIDSFDIVLSFDDHSYKTFLEGLRLVFRDMPHLLHTA